MKGSCLFFTNTTTERLEGFSRSKGFAKSGVFKTDLFSEFEDFVLYQDKSKLSGKVTYLGLTRLEAKEVIQKLADDTTYKPSRQAEIHLEDITLSTNHHQKWFSCQIVGEAK
jgi:spore maturation protein CgeB